MPLLLSSLAMCGGPASAAAAEGFEGSYDLEYRVFAGGVEGLRARVRLDLGPNGYRLGFSAGTRGFIGTLASWRTESWAVGRLGAAGVEPSNYAASNVWRGEERKMVLDFRLNGPAVVEAKPPVRSDGKEAVPPELARDTLDPLSAVLDLITSVAAGRECRGTIPVYDGRRRYDMVLQSRGSRTLQPNEYSPYGGNAQACAILNRHVAGKEPRRGVFGDREKEPIVVFLGQAMEGAPPIPLRAEMDGSFGALIVHLAKIERRSQTAETEPGR